MKKILYKLGMKAVEWGINRMWNYLDSNNNGVVEEVEIERFIEKVRDQLTKIKRKLNR